MRAFSEHVREHWHGGASMKFRMDHAGVWETSSMMFAHGERVSLNELREQMDARRRADLETMKMKEPEGIGGWNPLKYASAELGQEIVEFCAGRIGKKAIDILEGRVEPSEKAEDSFMDNPGPTD
jgi:creatinine amidohydrolase/Fe(II)-dependent formamide hydrolase-like protein